MNQKLNDVLQNLINGDKDAASSALSQYLHDKTAAIINPPAPPPSTPPKEITEGNHAFHVYKDGKEIDTVFALDSMSADEVKKDLVDHDGYDSDIVVKKSKKK